MPKKLDLKNLRFCLDNYTADHIFIRDCGGHNPDGSYRAQGLCKVSEELKDKKLDFKKDKTGLHILIDEKEVFHFPLKDYDKGFSLAYERIEQTQDGVGREIHLPCGVDPYDPKLPEPKSSTLRTILDDHLMEITFKGRIDLKFHSWWIKPHWKYWAIDKSKTKE